MSGQKTNTGASERTPLINGESATSHDETPHVQQQNGSTDTMTFFFSPKFTPGRHSENRVVRGLAHCWHITKVTLLSSMSFLSPVKIVWAPAPSLQKG